MSVFLMQAERSLKMAKETAKIVGSQEDYQRLGLSDTIQIREDALRTTGQKGEYEWWYYDAKMNDGSTLVVTFFSNNPTDNAEGFHPSVKVELTRADGTEVADMVSYPAESCSFSKDRCSVQIGDNRFEGDLHEYHIVIKTEKIEADITLTRSVPSWRPQTGHVFFGDKKYFAWLPSVPEGETHAQVLVAGKAETYDGVGYHDHNWGNAPMMNVLHHWYWGRAKIGPYTVISCYLTSTKKYGYTHLPIFMLAKGDKLICDDASKVQFSQLNPTLSKETGKHYHEKLVYEYEGDEGHFRITYHVNSMLTSFSLLADQGVDPTKFQKLMLRCMDLDPTYDRFSGTATLERIENGVVTEAYDAPAVWEMMYFHLDRDV